MPSQEFSLLSEQDRRRYCLLLQVRSLDAGTKLHSASGLKKHQLESMIPGRQLNDPQAFDWRMASVIVHDQPAINHNRGPVIRVGK